MKTAYFVAAILAALPLTATAQTSQATERQSPEMTAYDRPDAPIFGGIKIGSDSDYRWIDTDYALSSIASSTNRKKGDAGFRAHVGYDAQIGDVLVIGAEGGIGRGEPTVSATSSLGVYTLKTGWSWDASGRAGLLAAPSALVYGRAGYSWLRVHEKTDFRAVASKDLDSWGTEKGSLFGGGIEMAVSHRMFVRAEYNRVNYGHGLATSKALIGFSAGL